MEIDHSSNRNGNVTFLGHLLCAGVAWRESQTLMITDDIELAIPSQLQKLRLGDMTGHREAQWGMEPLAESSHPSVQLPTARMGMRG